MRKPSNQAADCRPAYSVPYVCITIEVFWAMSRGKIEGVRRTNEFFGIL